MGRVSVKVGVILSMNRSIPVLVSNETKSSELDFEFDFLRADAGIGLGLFYTSKYMDFLIPKFLQDGAKA